MLDQQPRGTGPVAPDESESGPAVLVEDLLHATGVGRVDLIPQREQLVGRAVITQRRDTSAHGLVHRGHLDEFGSQLGISRIRNRLVGCRRSGGIDWRRNGVGEPARDHGQTAERQNEGKQQ